MNQPDCHFFLQGSCTKGDACYFRHSAAAVSNPAICKFWLSASCTNAACPFRHPQLPGHQYAPVAPPKDRSKTPCYYEQQPSGCTKENCPFLHLKTDTVSKDGEEAVEDLEEELEESLEDLEEEGIEEEIKSKPKEFTIVKKVEKKEQEKENEKKIEMKPKELTVMAKGKKKWGLEKKEEKPEEKKPVSFGVMSFQDILVARNGGSLTTQPQQPRQQPTLKRRREENEPVRSHPQKIQKLAPEVKKVEENGAKAEKMLEIEGEGSELDSLNASVDDIGDLLGDIDGDVGDDDDLDDDDLRKELLDGVM